MPTTPRVGLPYPNPDSDPWYDQFVGFAESIDGSVYASREDRHLILTEGGNFQHLVDTITGKSTLSWTSTISITAPITGFLWQILAGSVSNIADGDVLYVSLPRAPTSNTAVTLSRASQVPSSDSDVVFGIRRGLVFYFRNGRNIRHPEIIDVLQSSTGSGGSGTKTFKEPAVLATTGDIASLSTGAPNTVDGAAVVAGDRILVWKQSTASQNGIYSVITAGTGSNGVWARSADANDSLLLPPGFVIVVTKGSTYSDKLYEFVTDAPITLGVTSLTFAVVGSDLATVAPPSVTSSSVPAAGSSAKASREDHVHGFQLNVRQGGTLIGARPELNFVGATVVDDSINNRIDITASSIGTAGQKLHSYLAMGINEVTMLTTPTVIGTLVLTGTDYDIAGTTKAFRLKACAFTVSGELGIIEIYDLTAGSSLGSVSTTSAVPVDLSTAVTLAAGTHTYEIRIKVSGAVGNLFCQWAGLEITNTF